jgi:hypothetical protein
MRPSKVVITEISASATEAVITFEDKTGLASSYILERSEDLTPESWRYVTTIIPTAHTSTVFQATDASPNGDTAFWRIKYLN